jgi:hypothetical protein
MKKLIFVATTLPTLALAHDSHTTSNLVHAAEHNIANPFFAGALIAGMVYGVYRLVKAYVKKKA